MDNIQDMILPNEGNNDSQNLNLDIDGDINIDNSKKNPDPDYDPEYDDMCPICYLSCDEDPSIKFKKCSQCKKNTCMTCIEILSDMKKSRKYQSVWNDSFSLKYKCAMCRFSNTYSVEIHIDIRLKRLILALKSQDYISVQSMLNNSNFGKLDVLNPEISRIIYEETSNRILKLLIEKKCIEPTPYIQYKIDQEYAYDNTFDYKYHMLQTYGTSGFIIF